MSESRRLSESPQLRRSVAVINPSDETFSRTQLSFPAREMRDTQNAAVTSARKADREKRQFAGRSSNDKVKTRGYLYLELLKLRIQTLLRSD